MKKEPETDSYYVENGFIHVGLKHDKDESQIMI